MVVNLWKFVKRLRELKVYFGLLVVEGVIDEELNVTDEEWGMLAPGGPEVCDFTFCSISHLCDQKKVGGKV